MTQHEIDVFLDSAYLVSKTSVDRALDIIFNTIDDLLLDDKFDICNQILESVWVDVFDLDLLLGFLTITFAAKSHLKCRERFFERVYDKCLLEEGKKHTEELLVGLE